MPTRADSAYRAQGWNADSKRIVAIGRTTPISNFATGKAVPFACDGAFSRLDRRVDQRNNPDASQQACFKSYAEPA